MTGSVQNVRQKADPDWKHCENKERKHETDMVVALWFYDACIPMNAINPRYFKQMISRVASMGHGYTGPNYHALRVTLLKEAKTQSCDVSDIVASAKNLCNLFSSIVEMVSEKNVVYMVTGNASNYKGAGKLLHAKYPGIYWSPCSAHCINLTLEDVGKMDLVQ
ncbi:hypothetical protein ACS0TY_034940 [Phlomoides rotata]